MTGWLKHYVDLNFKGLRVVEVKHQDKEKVRVALTSKEKSDFTFDYTISLKEDNFVSLDLGGSND